MKKQLKRLDTIYKELLKKNKEIKIFYLHIPRCGGNSIHSAFRKHFRPSRILIDNSSASNKGAVKFFKDVEDKEMLNIENNCYLQRYREGILLYNMYCEKYNYISGHYSFSELIYDLFKDQYNFITILRNPVKRFISEYFYNRYGKKTHFSIADDLDSFIDSSRGKGYGTKYVRMLCGWAQNEDYSSKEAIQKAKTNLAKFQVVGILEDLDFFKKQVEDKLNIKLKIRHKNKNPAQASVIEKKITDKILEKINLLCHPDKEIYRFALNNSHLHLPDGP